ncbi:MAG: PilC/PilY family type IV pilus protein, partial [Pseudomonadota bacterium]
MDCSMCWLYSWTVPYYTSGYSGLTGSFPLLTTNILNGIYWWNGWWWGNGGSSTTNRVDLDETYIGAGDIATPIMSPHEVTAVIMITDGEINYDSGWESMIDALKNAGEAEAKPDEDTTCKTNSCDDTCDDLELLKDMKDGLPTKCDCNYPKNQDRCDSSKSSKYKCTTGKPSYCRNEDNERLDYKCPESTCKRKQTGNGFGGGGLGFGFGGGGFGFGSIFPGGGYSQTTFGYYATGYLNTQIWVPMLPFFSPCGLSYAWNYQLGGFGYGSNSCGGGSSKEKKTTTVSLGEKNNRYLDNVARFLYKTDLRPVDDMPNELNKPIDNLATEPNIQNATTHIIHMPNADYKIDIDDYLQHVAENDGHGLYASATTEEDVKTAMKAILGNLAGKLGMNLETQSTETMSGASPEIFKMAVEDNVVTYVVSPSFVWNDWTGSLTCTSYTDSNLTGGVSAWTTTIPPGTSRNIYAGVCNTSCDRVEFTTANKEKLGLSSYGWGNDEDIEKKINNIRNAHRVDNSPGDSSIADIMHSAPVYVGPPIGSYGFKDENDDGKDDIGYLAFKSYYSCRPKMIYAGANDGMLHAFGAETGNERWAYIPANILPNIDVFSSEISHYYSVDLTPVVADVQSNSWSENNGWKTVLIGGCRLGGKEYFCLDITEGVTSSADPHFSVLWDKKIFSEQKSSNLPVVGKIKTSSF